MTYIKISIQEDVHIDVDEIWDEISDDDLKTEAKKRGLEVGDLQPFIEDKEAIRQIMIEKLGWNNFASDANVIHELRKMFAED